MQVEYPGDLDRALYSGEKIHENISLYYNSLLFFQICVFFTAETWIVCVAFDRE